MSTIFRSFENRDLFDGGFAFIDLETTGFMPERGDRIVELAIITCDKHGNELETFETLVNPKRAVLATEIHHITNEMVWNAPTIEELVGDIAYYLNGRHLVGHNISFDLRFIDHELGKFVPNFQPLSGICTLSLSRRFDPQIPKHSLDFLCEYFDFKHEFAHTAMDDCRATLQLFHRYKDTLIEVVGKGHSNVDIPKPVQFSFDFPKCGRCYKRHDAASSIEHEASKLQSLLMRLPGKSGDSIPVTQYIDILERAMVDRIISQEEAESLFSLAKDFGISMGQALEIHKEFLTRLTRIYLFDDIISKVERDDLHRVGKLLGFTADSVDEIIENEKSPANSKEKNQPFVQDIVSKSVCFTGELCSRINGMSIEREVAQRLAMERGMIIKSGVSKKLDYLVTADPNSLSGKAQKARELGINIIPEAVFWNMLGINVE